MEKLLDFLKIKKSIPNFSLIQLVDFGLQKKHFNKVKKLYRFSDNEMLRVLGITLKKFQSMKPSSRFNVSSTERIILMAELGVAGMDVFGSEESFSKWINSPSIDCAGKKPKEFLNTVYGFRELQSVLVRISHGIPH
jgi:putative toxin-antitoxin system antitoxin component (TIGR02293 family)